MSIRGAGAVRSSGMGGAGVVARGSGIGRAGVGRRSAAGPGDFDRG